MADNWKCTDKECGWEGDNPKPSPCFEGTMYSGQNYIEWPNICPRCGARVERKEDGKQKADK